MDYTFSSIERIGNSPIDNFYIDNSANIYSLDGDHTVYSLSPRSSVVVRNFPQDISTKRKLTEMEDTKFKDFSSTYHNVLDSDNESYIDDDYVEWNIALSPTIGTEDLQFLIRNFERKEDNDISDREDQILCDSPNNYCILIDFEDSTNEVTKEEEESETVYNAKNDDSSNEIGYKSDDIHVNINNLRVRDSNFKI